MVRSWRCCRCWRPWRLCWPWPFGPPPPPAQAQEATATCGSSPLDGRTLKVVSVIITRLGETNCSNVTATQLAGLAGELELSDQGLGSLRSDDFAGLSSLEELNLPRNSLTELPSGVFDGLSSLTHLRVSQNRLTAVPDGVFDDLTSLTFLKLNINELVWLPPDAFEELSNLEELHLNNNSNLACIHASQFDGLSSLTKLAMHNTNLGNINPTHFTRWSLNSLTELRFGNTLIANANNFQVDFATYQQVLPALVEANTYVNNSATLTDPICQTLERLADCGADNPLNGRTQKVVDVILDALPATDCSAVTDTQLAGITALHLNRLSLRALQDGDFGNLTGLQNLHIQINKLTTLPSDVFDGLSALERLDLFDNELTALPADVFDGLSSLEQLYLNTNSLTNLPEGVFNGLSDLERLDLFDNELTALPADVFDGLSALERLDLRDNSLAALPEDVFNGLSSLTQLDLYNNSLASLPADVFDGLSSLGQLNLYNNSLTTLPADVFDGLGFLSALRLQNNSLTTLPEGVFDGLTTMILLRLNGNSLEYLPPEVFDGPSNLRELYLTDNSPLACIHAGQFDGLSELRELHLTGTGLGNIAPAHASRWGLDELEELRFGDTPIVSSTINWNPYKAEFRDLVRDRTYVRDPFELSDPICGSIAAETDANNFHTMVKVDLEHNRVYPNRVQSVGDAGDGFCGADTGEDRRKLWVWQRSDDGVAWTDMASDRQPKDYGTRGAGECSFLYDPQADDNGKHVRAYVPVNTAGFTGENNYHSAAFGPLNIEQP